jgi:hypothetical protein
MIRSSVYGLAFALIMTACTSSPQLDAAGGPSPSSSASNIAETGTANRCTGTAAKSLDGERRKVRIELAPCRVSPGEAPTLRLENTGTTTIGYGPGFKLEKETDAGWRWVNKRQAFTLPLVYLKPGDRSDPEEVAVYLGKPEPIPLDPGVYRITKSVDLTPGKPRPPRMSVSTQFRVLNP